jgi:hypothetical protein
VRRALLLLAALALSGCRYHIEHASFDRAPGKKQLARLTPGETNLAEALAELGAPDGVEWGLDTDVLVYDGWELQKTHWELENPMTFVGRITPQALVGEAVAYVVFVAGRTGRVFPAPPKPGATPGRPGYTSKPLTLDGDEQGVHRVRLVFRRQSQVLDRVEVAHGDPRTSVVGLARGTFLR